MRNSMVIGLLASVSLTGLASPAFAQAAEDEVDNGTIIVTARKREENLIDVPLPVSVATAEQLTRDQVYTVTDLQRITPALEVSQTSGGEVNGGARLRGLGTGVFNASVSPSVAFVIDQVPQGNLTFPLMFDIGQVEVLRGPQGTLFGQGASAGVINISTAAPSTSGVGVSGGIDYSDKGSMGSEVGEVTARGAFNLPIGDQAAVRVATYYRKETGLQRNTALGLDNKIRDFGLRIRALLEPTDRFTVNISAEYAQQKIAGWNFFAIATTPNSTAGFDPDGPGPTPVIGTVGTFSTNAYKDVTGCKIPVISTRAEFYCEDTQARMNNSAGGVSASMAWEASDSISLTSVTAFRVLDRETRTVNFSRRLGVGARSENIENESDQFSQELRVNYTGTSLDLVAGMMYSKYNLKSSPINDALGFGSRLLGQRTGFSVCQNAGAFCPVPVGFTFEDTSNRNTAFFADATFALSDQLDLFGGLRYSDYTNTTGVGVNTYVAQRTSKISDKDISGRAGLSYKPTAGSTLYASVARGYKPPAIVVPTIATDPVTTLRPEKATALEIGGKFQVGRMQVSGNLFHTKVKDFQVQAQTFNAAGALVSVTQNISQVKSKGFELGVFGQISRNISINAGYQFNDVKFPAGFIGNDGRPLGGKQFLNAPKHKLTLSGDFSVPVSGSLEAFLNANLVYKSKVLLAQNGSDAFRYPGHEILNGSIGIRNSDDHWTISVFARNLTKEREPTGYLAGDFAGNVDGSLRAWPASGLTARVVGISAGFDF